MEITEEEYKALKEMFDILQQVQVSSVNNIHLMSAAFSRLQTILQNIDGRKLEELKNKEEK
jgi:hypothetical protein